MKGNRKLGKKYRFILGAVVILPVLFAVRIWENKVLTATPEASSRGCEADYEAYLEENGYAGVLSEEVISVDISAYATEGELEAEMGTEGVLTDGDGAITWTFQTTEAGFYNLEIGYIALPGTTSDIQRKIYIDGVIPYDDLSRVVMKRYWQDDEIRTKNNNELRPNSYEVYTDVSWTLEDSDRRNGEPLMLWLDKGSHTITFETIKEPMEITSLTFCAATGAESYAAVIGEMKEQYAVYSGGNIVLQAERTGDGMISVTKSSSSISVQKNHTDSEIVPYHAYYNRYNTIGSDTWTNPGDSICWTVYVEEEGLYALTFKGNQNTNRGVTSYRRLYINDEIPYEEMNAVGFDYSTEMTHYTIADEAGNPYLFHLQTGENTIALENVMGAFGEIITQVEESMKSLNEAYLQVIRLTGQAPYKYIDYQIGTKVEGFRECMEEESARLYALVDEIVAITGEKGENTALLQKMAIQAEGLAEDPEKVVEELSRLKDNISAIGTWLVTIEEMPLELDSLILSGETQELPRATDSFAAGLVNGTLRFFASFFMDSNTVGETEGGNSDVLTVWVASYGKEQAQIMQNMVDDSFTPDTGVSVRVQLIPADVVLRAALAGNGPDIVIGLSQSTTQDFAMRDATLDLSALEGYHEVTSSFYESTLESASFQGGVYGLPETAGFLMMFYREDILEDLALDVPETWDEFIELLPILQQNNYGAYIPNAYSGEGAGFYLSMVWQYGGDVYSGEGSDYGMSSKLGDTEAMEAFKDYTDFYVNYGLEVQVDFSNRFRTGEYPIGLTGYTTFCTLEIFAPEIKGLWSFAPIPGTVGEDGSIDNTVVVDTVNTVIMSQTSYPESAWEFVKWWMQTDTQLEYCQTVEAVMGTAARVASANPEVLQQLPWSNQELKALLGQMENTRGIAAVPGYYMTNRMISYSYSDVITNNSNPRETLYLNIKSIDKELTNKREELLNTN